MNSFEKRQLAERAVCHVGIDAGKFEHTLVCRRRGAADSKPFPFKTSRDAFEGASAFIGKASGDAPPSDVLVGIEFAGTYGFTLAHFLHALGYHVVSVLPAHTKRWKEVTHNQALKTDAKDAASITDLVAQGKFVAFPFLATPYAELRYLVSARESLTTLRSGAITRLKSILDVVFPEYERLFVQIWKPTSLEILKAFPGPDALLAAPKRKVLKVLKETSRNHLGEERYQELMDAARSSLALPGAQGALRDELPLIIERIELFDAQMKRLKARMISSLESLPEAPCVLSIPGVAPVTAAVFLGSLGDPQAYESSAQVLKLAGLSLVERSSGLLKGKQPISKRGRPVMRRHAFMFALRSVSRDGIFKRDYERLLENGSPKMSALTAISRKALKLMFSVAKERRPWTAEPPRPSGKRSVIDS